MITYDWPRRTGPGQLELIPTNSKVADTIVLAVSEFYLLLRIVFNVDK